VALWAMIFELMQIITRGGYYLETVAYFGTNPIMWDRFWMMAKDYFSHVKNVSFIMLVVFGLAFKYIKFDRWVLYAGLALIQALAFLGKDGSGPHYFLEFTAVLAVLIGMLTASLYQSARQGKGFPVVVYLFMVVSVIIGNLQEYRFASQTWKRVLYLSTQKSTPAASYIVMQNSRPGDLLLTKRVDLAVLYGRIPVMNDPYSFCFLANRGMWDDSKVVKMVRDGSFPLVILDKRPKDIDSSEFLSKALKAEVKSHYYLFAIARNAYFYRPRPLDNH
jgi:hypothetical protein